MKIVLTCEHAGNHIPEKYKDLFGKNHDVLDTHRGYDPGALDLFKDLKGLAFYNKTQMESRLLIEMNRSLHHPALFSEFTRQLSQKDKLGIIEEFYQPYRTEIEKLISKVISEGEEILHLSIHSFTPVLDGKLRNADIGLLYDPSRKIEKDFCKSLKKELQERNKSLKIRFNYPYRGTADGFTTSLRKSFPKKYSGIEIEVNQKFVDKNKMDAGLKSQFSSSLKAILGNRE